MADQRSERQLALETAAARQMRDYLLTITDDGQAIADTIDGETDLRGAIQRVLAILTDDQALVAGLKEIIGVMEARKSRFEARVERLRTAVERAMLAGELPTLQLPEATLSISARAPKIEVINESALPAELFDQQPAKLNKDRLKMFLAGGGETSGARMSNGSQSLTIRRA